MEMGVKINRKEITVRQGTFQSANEQNYGLNRIYTVIIFIDQLA
jgi:hypothetical protein